MKVAVAHFNGGETLPQMIDVRGHLFTLAGSHTASQDETRKCACCSKAHGHTPSSGRSRAYFHAESTRRSLAQPDSSEPVASRLPRGTGLRRALSMPAWRK